MLVSGLARPWVNAPHCTLGILSGCFPSFAPHLTSVDSGEASGSPHSLWSGVRKPSGLEETNSILDVERLSYASPQGGGLVPF